MENLQSYLLSEDILEQNPLVIPPDGPLRSNPNICLLAVVQFGHHRIKDNNEARCFTLPNSCHRNVIATRGQQSLLSQCILWKVDRHGLLLQLSSVDNIWCQLRQNSPQAERVAAIELESELLRKSTLFEVCTRWVAMVKRLGLYQMGCYGNTVRSVPDGLLRYGNQKKNVLKNTKCHL